MTKFNQTKYLRKLKFKKYSKYLYLGSLCLLCFGIGVYFTYSKYSVSKDTEVVKTIVGDFISGDVVIGSYINGEYSKEIPEKNSGYDVEKVVCDNNATGKWNYDDWSLTTRNLTTRTKCNVYFIDTTTYSFDYIGEEQIFTIPKTGIYKLEIWGAQGGGWRGGADNTATIAGGVGGYAKGEIKLSSGSKIYVNVGGFATVGITGYSGGGATSIATSPGLLPSLENSKSSILIVAGGGGGSEWTNGQGGSGGGYIGSSGQNPSDNVTGGTQTSGGKSSGIHSSSGTTKIYDGSFGKGGYSADGDGGGSGGDGYYGGGASSFAYGGAGGSGYIGNSLLSNKAMYCYNCEESSEESTKTISTTCSEEKPTENCSKKGNGYARITFISAE